LFSFSCFSGISLVFVGLQNSENEKESEKAAG
jgi:hypothetical protein